jgi:olefin beta-lactone synthetase
MRPDANIASMLPAMAATAPHRPAILFPAGRDARGKRLYSHYTFRQLDHDSDVLAAGLETLGIGRGVRTVLMVKPSLEFFALTFAIFKAGAVPVLIDPGIGPKVLKSCIGESLPEAFIGIPPAHAARAVLGWGRGTVKTLVTVGSKWFWGGYTLDDVRRAGRPKVASGWKMASTQAEEVAAILFTSGSTGVPKGAVYQHGNFMAQVEAIRRTYDIQPGEIDLPTFPLFALFDPALGMTTVVPDMDFSKPAQADPRLLIEAIEDWGCTNMFGSPALLDSFGRYGEEHGVTLETVRRVISAGAPVPAAVMQRVVGMLPEGALIHTPYGATESLPVASVDSDTLLGETSALTEQGRGVCVGNPVEEADVRVIRISDEAIETWSDDLCVPAGQIGEIVVRSPMVTREYFGRPDQTAMAKMKEPGSATEVRHRMGDLGYFDDRGRLWFCGRKSHRLTTPSGPMFTVPCEAIFNAHPKVYRTALVGVGEPGQEKPALCVELEKGHTGADRAAVEAELRELGSAHKQTRSIEKFAFHPGFPVDIRHNAKIGRPALAQWATGQGA